MPGIMPSIIGLNVTVGLAMHAHYTLASVEILLAFKACQLSEMQILYSLK